MFWRVLFPATLLFQGALAHAGLIRVTPADVLEFEFRLTSPPLTILDGSGNPTPPDMLYFALSNTSQLNIEAPVGFHTASLFDGATLLGTMTNNLGGERVGPSNLEGGAWRTAASRFRGGVPPVRDVVIDFTSILDGTIQGLIQYTIEKGSFTFDLSTLLPTLKPGLGAGTGVFSSRGGVEVEITRISLQNVPEPTILALLGLGLASFGYVSRRKLN